MKFLDVPVISLETTMMQLISESTSLSSSSLSNISNEELSSIKKTKEGEDPDFILSSRGQIVQQEISSIWNLHDRDNPFPSRVSLEDVLEKQSPLDGWKKLNPKPYIAFADLNNSKDDPYGNMPKSAIEIGLRWEF